ncbi:MAG TPA: TolC family protein [Ohtaekwangia sp.]|nr:TolC family protein [Ohtaekwangia sp.]
MKNFIIIVLLAFVSPARAQQTVPLTLADCHAKAEANYPLVRQRELIQKSGEFSISNASKGRLPQLMIAGQYTTQSDVTGLPVQLPGVDVPTLSKEQYKVYGEVTLPLYDGGVVKYQKQAHEAGTRAEAQKLEVELYQLKDRINQLFFGILLLDEQLKQNDLLKEDIQRGILKTEAAIENGTAFRSSADVLRAELLRAGQHTVALATVRSAYITMLSRFTGIDTGNLVLEKPQQIVLRPGINRPEMSLFHFQEQTLDVQDRMLASRNLPRLNAFVQAGYGRPALNMLSNDLDSYYIGGLRLTWNLTGHYTHKKEKALLDLQRDNIALQKETFLFNTDLSVHQQNAEVVKFQQLLASDEAIIALRASIKNTAVVQLENGVISPNDYLKEASAEDQARLSKIQHEIQLLLAQYTQQTLTGNL